MSFLDCQLRCIAKVEVLTQIPMLPFANFGICRVRCGRVSTCRRTNLFLCRWRGLNPKRCSERLRRTGFGPKANSENRNLGLKGTVNEGVGYPREIFRPAITHPSFGFVLLHNQPSGFASPSAADLQLTKRIADGARILYINFLDQVIVGQPIGARPGYFSFQEAGLL